MSKKEYNYNYSNLGDSPYNKLLNREDELTYKFGGNDQDGGTSDGSSNNNGTTQRRGGSVATVYIKSDGNAGDFWIKSFIRSLDWKPKKVGFYINGLTGYAEFTDVYISGTIVVAAGSVGGFDIGADYIRDNLNTMGMASTVTGGDDVRFWAGETFANRAAAPFRVLESGALYAVAGNISGGIISNLTGVVDPTVTPTSIGQVYVNIIQDEKGEVKFK